jgi:Family of unknown function (DUF6510)
MPASAASTRSPGSLANPLSAMPQHPDRPTSSRDYFGTGAFAAAECAACGRQASLASNPVIAADELQVRCAGCGSVIAQVRSSPHATWLDVRGIRRVRPDGPDDISRSHA